MVQLSMWYYNSDAMKLGNEKFFVCMKERNRNLGEIWTELMNIKENLKKLIHLKFWNSWLKDQRFPMNNLWSLALGFCMTCVRIRGVQSTGWLDTDFIVGNFLQKWWATCWEKCLQVFGISSTLFTSFVNYQSHIEINIIFTIIEDVQNVCTLLWDMPYS
jgi:hypothetical protein